MNPEARKALQYETDFLSGVETNMEAAKGKEFRGTLWQRSQQDERDRLRALMAGNQNFDRELLESLPANRRIVLRGFERRFLFGKRPTGVVIASVLTPLSHFASSTDDPPPQIGLGELMDHVRQLSGGRHVPHVIGVCSPSGFTDEARTTRINIPNVTVVLIEPDGHGGWRTQAASESVDHRVPKIFDPETANQKLNRVRRVLEDCSADLLTGGVSLSSVARKANLPEEVARQAFERVAREDPELRLTKRAGEMLLYRGAPVQHQEKRSMGVIDRIKQLLSGEGNEVEKVNLLAERRAALAQRRDRIYEDIGKLEGKEAELLAQGKAATSDVPRRRLAAQLAQLRKDIARQNTTAAMLNQQINIISTDIHNLTLIQQGETARLPDTEELTENAVRAEELLESLRADSELVGGLTTGVQEVSTSEEELAILDEFQAADQPVKTDDGERRPVKPVADQPVPEQPPAVETELPEKTRGADPEPM